MPSSKRVIVWTEFPLLIPNDDGTASYDSVNVEITYKVTPGRPRQGDQPMEFPEADYVAPMYVHFRDRGRTLNLDPEVVFGERKAAELAREAICRRD